MADERPNIGQDDVTDAERATDPLTMSEGVGGLPELDEDERATVGDVDDDNLLGDEPLDTRQ